MAANTGTFYIRPSADVSLTHPVYPETLGAGYLAINEVVSDETATYIGWVDYPTTTKIGLSQTSRFRMSMETNAKITKVLSATFKYAALHTYQYAMSQGGGSDEGNGKCTVFVSGEEVFSGRYYRYQSGTEDTLTDADMPNLVTALNTYIGANSIISIPEILIDITDEIHITQGSKAEAVSSYVTQVAIELTCEYVTGFDMHDKANGSWSQVTSAYKKSNGAWGEITEEECRSILSSSLVIR